MPQIKIKRGSSSSPTLDDGELYLANGGDGEGKLYAGTSDGDTNTDKVRVKYSDNSDYAEKVGTESSHPQIGSPTIPVYVADDGTVTPSNASVGSLANPTIIKDGEIQGVAGTYSNQDPWVYLTMGATEDNDGSCYPLYVSGTVNPSDNTKYDIAGLRHTNKYAGGTRVFQNGTSGDADKGHQNAYIYAPSYAPSNGSPDHKVAVYDNEQSGAVWLDDDIGGITNPVYIKDGAIKSLAGYYSDSDYDIVEQIMADSDGQYGQGEYYPVYVSGTLNPPEGNATIDGIKHCPIYAGGSRVRMNGNADNKYVSDPVIYAPSSGGTAGQVLVSNGAGNAPGWKSHFSLPIITPTPTTISDNGLYAINVRVSNDGHTADVTVMLAVTDKTTLNMVTEYVTLEGGFTALLKVSREVNGSLSVSSGSYSASIYAVYKIADLT